MEYDLLGFGLRLAWLGTEALTWRELLVVAKQGPSTSAIRRALDKDAAWGLPEHLLAASIDQLRLLVWLNTKDALTGTNQPEPFPRPGAKPSGNRVGRSSVDLDQMAAWLAKRNPAQHTESKA